MLILFLFSCRCAVVSDSYEDTVFCLTSMHLASPFDMLGVTNDSQFLHRFILVDLYLWSLIIGFVSIPAITIVAGGAFLLFSLGVYGSLMITEKFIRWVLRTTIILYVEQIDEFKKISGMVKGTDDDLNTLIEASIEATF